MTNPTEDARIYESTINPPHSPRTNVFHYLFPPIQKGRPPRYYPTPDPNSVAFIDALTGRTLFRSDLPIQAQWLNTGLRSLGVEKGEVACIFGENSLEWVSACYGAQAAGMIVSPVNYGYTAEELLHQLKDSGAVLVFVAPALVPVLEKALKLGYNLDPKRIILMCQPAEKPEGTEYQCIEELWRRLGRARQTVGDGESNTAYLCYSSGTTGKAKGVETSHHNMTSQVQALRTVYEPLGPTDAILAILPFGHIYGLTTLLHHPLTVPAPVIVLPRFDLENFLSAIQKYKVTWTLVVPPVLIAIINSPLFAKYDLSSLKGLVCAAAPTPVDLIRAFEAKFPLVKGKPSCRVTQGYGLTETSPITHVMTAKEGAEHQGSIGRVIPTMQARLVDHETGQDVKQGERGELWVRGASVMKGYWKNPQATENTFAEGGWFKTGDVAMADKDGYFFIVDRIKELIKYKGYQVPPAELEALLLTHPLVIDAGVVGIYDKEQATELPRAYVVPKGGLAAVKDSDRAGFPNDVETWVQKRVAQHKRLRGGVVLVDAIPRSTSGKILRRTLRERAVGELEQKAVGRVAKL